MFLSLEKLIGAALWKHHCFDASNTSLTKARWPGVWTEQFLFLGHSTIFRKQMGAMEVVPFFGSNFNKVLPVFLMLHCLLILCNIWQRVARAIAPSYLEFDAAPGNDESSARGRLLIRAEQVHSAECV